MKLESEMYSQTTWHGYHMLDKARRSMGILLQGKNVSRHFAENKMAVIWILKSLLDSTIALKI